MCMVASAADGESDRIFISDHPGDAPAASGQVRD
jgi:hypothetical protein